MSRLAGEHRLAASRAQLAVRPDYVAGEPRREERVVVPVPGLNRAVVQAINVGRSGRPGKPVTPLEHSRRWN